MSHSAPTLDHLNTGFALQGALHFAEAAPGLPVAEINTPLASARIALQGGQVLAWQPAGHQPVIWVSTAAVYEPGKGVRGGVPVCWPWFGARDGGPAHGFVRTRLWQVRETKLAPNGDVTVRLGIVDDASTCAMWNHGFDLELAVTVGTTLTMALTTLNTGDMPIAITQALHTYFCAGHIGQTMVRGLEACTYLDKVENFAAHQQTGAVRFAGETDRIYIGTLADCLIEDGANHRVIRVAKKGSASTVVWNPWSEREKSFADMVPGEYQQMLCVETCNAGPDQVSVLPGDSHTLIAEISIV
ncbi:MAG: D-hexose-6-phosphate mutarotase [Rhodoferax sp.]|nr:D-hexose-6-phosphate mutarotase [Rhodoferax sp.]